MKSSRQFGVQSYCFRVFKDNAVVAKMVREIGLDRIEICGVHANFDDPAGFAEVVRIYRETGVEVVSIGVQTFVGADSERAWFECARVADVKFISAHFRVDSFAKAVPRVKALAAEYGIRVGIHCHGGYMFGGSPDVLEHLIDLGGPEVGVWLDTAWALQIGPYHGNPVKWVERFGKRIHGVHYKDFIFDRAGRWQDVIVGTGNLDLPAFVSALDGAGFEGAAIIEYEADADNPVPALKKCVEAMRAV